MFLLQIWVQTVVRSSSFVIATTVGFYRCFNFISGQNEKEEEIEMTGPVLIKPLPEILGYSISFFAPSRYEIASLHSIQFNEMKFSTHRNVKTNSRLKEQPKRSSGTVD